MNNKYLIIVEVKNDFVTGALCYKSSELVVPKIMYLSDEFDNIILTKDTHFPGYENTLEGARIPAHCKFKTEGYSVYDPLYNKIKQRYTDGDCTMAELSKTTFGTFGIKSPIMSSISNVGPVELHLCGLLTDICVITNALILRTQFPNAAIFIHKDCCVGSSVENHNAALKVAESCLIDII